MISGNFKKIHTSADEIKSRSVYTSKDIVVKRITIKGLSIDDKMDVYHEVQQSKMASVLGIGPEIYNTVHTENFVSIFMKKYDYDLSRYLLKKDVPSSDKKRAVEKAFTLVKKAFDNGIFCYDIKPSNFVIDEQTGDVKMIDFDMHCDHAIFTEDDIPFIMAYLYLQFLICIPVDRNRYVPIMDRLCNFAFKDTSPEFYTKMNDSFMGHTIVHYANVYFKENFEDVKDLVEHIQQ